MNAQEIVVFLVGIFTILGFILAVVARISKLETRADVCDEKHRENEKKHEKQDEINIKIEEHHVEVMQAIAIISTKIETLIRK
jgi:Na+-transporting methylmalonyl-CoA/oxaloacetate decarboxylase gamma subunit